MPPRTPPRLRHLLLDFDETLTVSDTLAPLTTLAYSLHPPHLPALPPWSHFTHSYLASLPPSPPITTLPAYLAHLSSPSVRRAETDSLARIASHGVFRGFRELLLRPAPGTVKMREGFWRQLMKPALERGWGVTVVSVNWSSVWIRECLRAGVREEGGDEAEIERVEIKCNELETGEDGLTTGRWVGEEMVVAGDKVRVLEEVRARGEEGVVYVGDSEPDLGAMMEAEVGVVVGRKMEGLLGKLRVRVVRAEEAGTVDYFVKLRREMSENVLVRVEGMEELGRLLGFVDTKE